jgi:hypothetical protein
MLLLDMLLGNADRLPCRELGWRGNAGNVLYGAPGGRHAGRVVAIDSAVQRRPPALRSGTEDARVERLATLLLHSADEAAGVLQQVRPLRPRPPPPHCLGGLHQSSGGWGWGVGGGWVGRSCARRSTAPPAAREGLDRGAVRAEEGG